MFSVLCVSSTSREAKIKNQQRREYGDPLDIYGRHKIPASTKASVGNVFGEVITFLYSEVSHCASFPFVTAQAVAIH